MKDNSSVPSSAFMRFADEAAERIVALERRVDELDVGIWSIARAAQRWAEMQPVNETIFMTREDYALLGADIGNHAHVKVVRFALSLAGFKSLGMTGGQQAYIAINGVRNECDS